jgi:hypothetical protein
MARHESATIDRRPGSFCGRWRGRLRCSTLSIYAWNVEGELAEIHRQIENLFAEALARSRIAGSPRIEAGRILLVGGGPTVGVELGALSEQWPALAPELRRRRAGELASRLTRERRSFSPAPGFRDVARLPGFFAPSAIWAVFRWLGPSEGAGRPSSEAGAEDSESVRRAREARVCEATLERVNRGTPIGPSDAEGWVVELMLLRGPESRDLYDDPALATFVERLPSQSAARFRWNGAPALSAISGVDTSVWLRRLDLGDPLAPALRGLSITFSGRYVASYFREHDRLEYERTAAALSDRLNAKYAALYARCAHLTRHQLGSWFLGPGAGGAATSVVYFMGTYAGVSHVKSAVLHPTDAGAGFDRAFALAEIAKAAEPLDRSRVLDLIGKHGGMIAGRAESSMTISFPFKEGNRAARTSLDIARSLNLAAD